MQTVLPNYFAGADTLVAQIDRVLLALAQPVAGKPAVQPTVVAELVYKPLALWVSGSC
ncbi:MAG TPA: hypothetical protein VFB79_05415 [Candidatus Angelobacter sp.]|nr:hypothetical protein [Candidatus Angelobacter sp.]